MVTVSGNGMCVRPAWPDDLPAIEEIYGHYVRASTATFEQVPPDRAEWGSRYRRIAAHGLPFCVAEAAGRIGGYGYCAPWRARPAYRHTVEDSVYVAPWATGRGVGSALLGELLDRCADRGIRQVIAVIVDAGDPASVALHRRHGFREVGRLAAVGYKHGRWLDTLLLQRGLGARLH